MLETSDFQSGVPAQFIGVQQKIFLGTINK